MVDFFKAKCYKHPGTNCQKILKSKKFGICDDASYPHSYVDAGNHASWVVPVYNDDELAVLFIPVDKSLNILKGDGKTESTCDAILTYENNIVFIELKESDPPWIAKAIEQLKITIGIFDGSRGLHFYRKRRAFASNKRAAGYAYNLQEEMDDFRRITGVRLIIEASGIII
jgi:hypothetical protein